MWLVALIGLLASRAVVATEWHPCPYMPSKAAPAIVGVAVAEGQALEESNVRYCEFHYLKPDGSGSLVLFQQESNVAFARKALSYSPLNDGWDTVRPGVQQSDNRNGEKRQAAWRGNQVEMAYGFRSADNQQPLEVTRVDASEVDIIDAGFDTFVRNHWLSLVSEAVERVGFASPVHGRVLPLQVVHADAKHCLVPAQTQVETDATTCFQVRVANPLLRWLVSPLRLTYRAHDRALLVYSGTVNLLDEQKRSQQATIYYFYQPGG